MYSSVMFVACEYVTVCIGNSFSGDHTKTDMDIDDVIEKLIPFLEEFCSHEIYSYITRHELQCACFDPRYFSSILCRVMETRAINAEDIYCLDWNSVLVLFGIFAKTVKCSLVLKHGSYHHLIEFNKVLKMYEVNKWIQRQRGQWDALLDYLQAVKKLK